jgi:hypothetical protein
MEAKPHAQTGAVRIPTYLMARDALNPAAYSLFQYVIYHY